MVKRRPPAGLVLLVVAACGGDPAGHETAQVAKTVPGIETAVATTESIRGLARIPGVVVPDGLTPDARDARSDLATAEARATLATQQTARLRALAPGDVSPRKELEAAIAEETSARAAALRARQLVLALGGRSEPSPLESGSTWIVGRVPQESVAQIVAGAPAEFTADLDGRPTFLGTVDAAPTFVDPASRTAPVRVRTADAASRLIPGMTGSLAVEIGALHDAVVVPQAAVVYDERHPLAFVEDGHGGFTQTVVTVGVARGGRIEITSGLAPGARVATSGAASLLSAARLATSGAD